MGRGVPFSTRGEVWEGHTALTQKKKINFCAQKGSFGASWVHCLICCDIFDVRRLCNEVYGHMGLYNIYGWADDTSNN